MNLNKVILVGRLTRDPETKALPSGQSVTTFSMATDRFFNDKSGQRQQLTDFHNIVLFGRLADVAAQYTNKGSLIMIEGRIQTRSWDDNTGVKKWRTEIIGERLQLGPRSGGKTSAPATADNVKDAAIEDIPVIEEDEEIDVKNIPF